MCHRDKKSPIEGMDVDGQDLSSDLSVESGDAGTGTDMDGMDLSADTATEGDDLEADA